LWENEALILTSSKIFVRKELNFGRMTEGDRKQIAAEVCAS
jgi:hypothetical protein